MDMKEVITHARAGDWVLVSERMPEECVSVQVTYRSCFDGKHCCDGFAFRSDGYWCWSLDDSECEVEIIAWKPCCEPYEEKQEN